MPWYMFASFARFGLIFAPQPQSLSRQRASVATPHLEFLSCGKIPLHRHGPRPPSPSRQPSPPGKDPFEARLWVRPSASKDPRGNYTAGVLPVNKIFSERLPSWEKCAKSKCTPEGVRQPTVIKMYKLDSSGYMAGADRHLWPAVRCPLPRCQLRALATAPRRRQGG